MVGKVGVVGLVRIIQEKCRHIWVRNFFGRFDFVKCESAGQLPVVTCSRGRGLRLTQLRLRQCGFGVGASAWSGSRRADSVEKSVSMQCILLRQCLFRGDEIVAALTSSMFGCKIRRLITLRCL